MNYRDHYRKTEKWSDVYRAAQVAGGIDEICKLRPEILEKRKAVSKIQKFCQTVFNKIERRDLKSFLLMLYLNQGTSIH